MEDQKYHGIETEEERRKRRTQGDNYVPRGNRKGLKTKAQKRADEDRKLSQEFERRREERKEESRREAVAWAANGWESDQAPKGQDHAGSGRSERISSAAEKAEGAQPLGPARVAGNRNRTADSSRMDTEDPYRSKDYGNRSENGYGPHRSNERPRYDDYEEELSAERRGRGPMRLILILIVVVLVIAAAIFLLPTLIEKFSAGQSSLSGSTSGISVEEGEETTVFVGLTDVAATAQITQYFTYGTSFCLDGTADLSVAEDEEDEEDTEEDSEDPYLIGLYLILRNANQPEQDEDPEDLYTYELEYTIEGTAVTFASYTYINDGICLESIAEGDYCMLLKAEYNDGSGIYFSLENASDETEDICYYTITNNGTNNRIDITFDSYEDTSWLSLYVEQSELPEDVYDIVIDPGHGGNDGGATNGEYTESVLMLQYALDLKEALEEAGYKVLITRDGTESSDADLAYNIYNEDGRVTLACASRAKYCLSLHLNSNSEYLAVGGIQCYISCRAQDSFASLLVDNIVSYTGTNYSVMESYLVSEGVYARAFTQAEIDDTNADMVAYGLETYDSITTDTDYYFMIRELGGIATNAYADGRNIYYGANEYMDSIQGVESYILELGFITVSSDLQSILNNEDEYIQAIVDSFLQLQEETSAGTSDTQEEAEVDTGEDTETESGETGITGNLTE